MDCLRKIKLQEIDTDITQHHQAQVRQVWGLWRFHGIFLFINLVGGLTMLIKVHAVMTFVYTLICFVVLVPLSYFMWFKTFYKAFQNHSAISYGLFVLTFGIHFVLAAIIALGIPGFSTGVINTVIGFGHGLVYALFLLGFTLVEIAYVFSALIIFRAIYRNYGATLNTFRVAIAPHLVDNDSVERGDQPPATTTALTSATTKTPSYTEAGNHSDVNPFAKSNDAWAAAGAKLAKSAWENEKVRNAATSAAKSAWENEAVRNAAKQAATDAWKNETVRNAAIDAATNSVKNNNNTKDYNPFDE